MTVEVAISGSTLIAVLLLSWRVGKITEQHRIMWRHFEKSILKENY